MNTYKLTQDERFAIVMECRQSGMTDRQWCEEHGICTHTLYRWIKKFRDNGYPNIPAARKTSSSITTTPQQAVKLDVVSEIDSSLGLDSYYNSHSDAAVEIIRGNTLVRINNHASHQLVDVILRNLGGSL